MGKNDMNHMIHLESVALSDCAVLQTKESTYQGSWKRSGGASAWFMFRRNMDRLITMMSPKEYPSHITTPQNVKDTVMVLDSIISKGLYDVKDLPGAPAASQAVLAMLADRFTSEDIFMKIREQPSGNDGTVLACLRDMRRYAMLVEAEMIAEGVVEPESKTYEQETGMYHPPETDVYQLIADEKGLSRDKVKERIHKLFYSSPPPFPTIELAQPPIDMYYPKATVRLELVDEKTNYVFPNAVNVQVVFGDTITIRLEKGEFSPPYFHAGLAAAASPASDGFRTSPITEDEINAVIGVRELKPHDQPVIIDGLVHQAGVPPRRATEDDYKLAGGGRFAAERAGFVKLVDTPSCGDGSFDVRMQRKAEAVADGGSQHAEQNPLFPWHATRVEFEALCAKHPAIMDLFYTVRALGVFQLEPIVDSQFCPKELYPAYVYAGDNKWTIRRSKVPAELEDNFPRLRLELNHKEWEEIKSDYQPMYYHDSSDLKWKIRAEFTDWGREAG